MCDISIDYNLFSSDGNNTSLNVNKQKVTQMFLFSWSVGFYFCMQIYIFIMCMTRKREVKMGSTESLGGTKGKTFIPINMGIYIYIYGDKKV